MIRTAKRLRLCVTLLIVNLAFIWGNSLLPGGVSGALSHWLRNVLAWLFDNTGTPDGGHGLLRKIAHFTEFCCLGLCLCWLFGMLRQSRWQWVVSALGAGVLAACVDECIQMFVPGRGPGILDVAIDSSGVLLGIIILTLTQKRKSKQLEKAL